MSGQYYTTNIMLKEKVLEFIQNNPRIILEPCIGQGDLVKYITDNIPDIIFHSYEIDNTIELLEEFNVVYTDFLKEHIYNKYITIIGNPPFVRTKNSNLYLDFISKCYNLLDNNGELIFIVPSDFFKLTTASNILLDMISNGSFTHIYHPHNERLFENAIIDVLIFRYEKGIITNKVLYNDIIKIINCSNGMLTFDDYIVESKRTFEHFFNILVGFVSAKEEVFKNDILGNIEIVKGDNIKDKYILIKEFPCDNDVINDYLIKNKTILINRKIRKFDEFNWFEWGALRNKKFVDEHFGKECIYIHMLTRNKKVAFIGKVEYFGSGLLLLIPKNTINLLEVVNYLNSDKFKHNFMFSGRFKISQWQLSNCYY